jgi:cytochrome b561
MAATGTPTAYTPTAKALHWLVVALLAVQYVTAWLMPHIGRRTPPSAMVDLHLSLGLVILLVMLMRLAYRLRHPVPPAATGAPWERLLARITHGLIYLILLVAPFLGWASASAHHLSVSLFGLISLPDLVAPGTRWAHEAGDVHGTAMWALLWLVGLHAAAALYHHLVRRDGTLQRMLPSGR